MSGKKISVIIPTYNSERYILKAVTSVFNQTCFVDEVIIVDDGSNDGTQQRIKDFLSSWKQGAERIMCHTQTNQGPAAARNTGIRMACGEYIAFLDSDDVWIPHKIEAQLKVLETNSSIGLVCAGRYRVTEKKASRKMNCVGKHLTGNAYRDLWVVGNFIVTSSVMARKECFKDVGIFDRRAAVLGAEDMDMWFRIASRFGIYYINEPLVEYLVRQEGVNRSNVDRAYQSAINVVEKHQAQFVLIHPDGDRIVRGRKFALYFDYGKALMDCHKLEKAGEKFRLAIHSMPFNVKARLYWFLTRLPLSLIVMFKRMKRGVI